MNLEISYYSQEFTEKFLNRASLKSESVGEQVAKIIEDVKSEGDIALRRYTEKFDGSCPNRFELDRKLMKEAFENIDDEFREAIILASHNIRKYHEKQLQKGYETKGPRGEILGQVVRGLEKVAVYVPGGTAVYPSTVLMNVIPAKIAEVQEIIMVTPKADSAILATAFVAGVDRIFISGGAQIIAALAYGTETIPKVDKIVGPGNIYVATAKKMLFGKVAIDMIAGPSEILVIADDTANPAYIAADMLSQAEHDELAGSVLLTSDKHVAEKTLLELERQLEKLPRNDIARKSLENYGAILLCKNDREMAEICNSIAPEHVEILTEEPLAWVNLIKNAGSVFLGEYTPEPIGDYFSGTNHVLPTSGTARFSSPLGVYDFIKRMSYTMYTKKALEEDGKHVVRIAEQEGLDAHATAVKKRLEDGGNYGK